MNSVTPSLRLNAVSSSLNERGKFSDIAAPLKVFTAGRG
jgi:hypothetical protein